MDRNLLRRAGFIAAAAVAAIVLAAGLTLALSPPGSSTSVTRTSDRAGHAQLASSPQPGPAIQITPVDVDGINPRTPIVVHTGGTLEAVSAVNTATGALLTGTLSKDHRTWTSTEPLGYGSSYRVAVTAIGRQGAIASQTGTVTTLSPAAQTFTSVLPSPGQSDVGVGQPIVVRFDKDVTDRAAAEKVLQVTSNPPQTGSWFWMSNAEAHYRPQQYWQPGTVVTLNARLYGLDLGDGVYGHSDRSETFRIHDSWIAKADGATEQMQIFHGGQLVKTMPVSLGSRGFPSHSGPHVISDKQPSIVMDSCTYGVCKGQRGYYRERVDLDERISNDGEFVHSAPWSVGQQGDSNVSHGCVNLSPDNARWFYDHFGLGDVVEITNSGGPPLPVWDTYGDWELPWSQWQAGSALQ